MLVVVVLLATVVLRAVIVLTFVYLILPKRRVCPRCGAPLTRIRHSILRLLLPMVEHRWCLECGWSGIIQTQSRVVRRAARSLTVILLVPVAADLFPSVAARELAALKPDVTLADWTRTHQVDSLVTEPTFPSQGKEEWCARASMKLRLPDSSRVTRHAYFYVPPLTQRSSIPVSAGPQTITRLCVLGALWIETSVPTGPSADTLAAKTASALLGAYGGDPLPWPDWYELPLGRLFRETVTARSQADSTVVLTAGDRPIRGMPRVVALAFTPLSRLNPPHMESIADRYRRESDSVRSVAVLTGLDSARIAPLLSLLMRADSIDLSQPPRPERARLRAAAVTTFRDWLAASRGLPSSRRAYALLAADMLLANPSVQSLFQINTEDSLPGRVPLAALGAGFEHEYYNDQYVYAHTWLNQAFRLDPRGRAGGLAFLSLIEAGFDTLGFCGSGEEPFQEVIDRGEAYMATLADSSLRARLHFVVGDGYAEIVGLAAGMGDYNSGDSTPFLPRAAAARAKALEHYRAGLALDRRTPPAESAWRTSWRLAAGLPPVRLRFLCLND